MYLRPSFDLDQTIDQTNYYWFEHAFNGQELEWLENLQNLYNFETASTIAGDTNDFRKSKIKWMHHDNASAWVYDRLKDLSVEANSVWKFNLHTIVDSIQYTEYYATENGHYTWHQDFGPGGPSLRKISITVQLSGPDEYERPDLEYWRGGNDIERAPRDKGVVFIFPSYMMHRVTPVTKGTRRSFVLWVGGEHYK